MWDTRYDPRQSTFPHKGEQDLINSFTGESLKRHREGYIYPQSSANYKFPQQSITCFNSIKKMTELLNSRKNLDPFCRTRDRKSYDITPYVCMFSKEPTFLVRGLCKEAQMDTQYKLEDHRPGPAAYGKDTSNIQQFDKLLKCFIGD